MAVFWRAFLDALDSTFADAEDPEDAGARDLSGFPNLSDSSLAMDGNDLEISPTGSSFTVWENGVSYDFTATQSVTITADDDLTFVYFSGGVLSKSTTAWDITATTAPVCLVYKEGSNYIIFEERHGHNRDRNWHEWAHSTVGTSWDYGLAGTFDNTTLSMTQGSVHDEDIELDSGGVIAACRLWYRNVGATAMEWENNISTPYKAAAGVIQYDNAGTLTNVDNAKHVQSWVFMTNAATYPIAVVVGQAQYATVAAARNDSPPVLPTLTTREWKLLYSVLYKNVGGTPTYVEQVDYREVGTGPGSSYSPAVHADLTGRDTAASHPAAAVDTDVTSFGGALSGADTEVQAALDTLDDHGHSTLGDGTGVVTLVSTDVVVKIQVSNDSGSGMSKGDVCYISGDSSGVPQVTLADADAAATCSKALVIINETIDNGADGEAIVFGVITGMSGLTAGAIQYVHTTAGDATETAPSGSGDIVRILGYAISTTEIFFNPDNTYIEVS
jgi:hypothetical protein